MGGGGRTRRLLTEGFPPAASSAARPLDLLWPRAARLQRRLAKARRGSNRRKRVKAQVVKLKARAGDRRNSVCKIVDREARESRAVFRCRYCGYTANADANAARSLKDAAPGHGVAARRALQALAGAVNREPQLIAS